MFAVPGVELLQGCRHRLGPGGDALLGGGFELAELAGHLRHQGGRLLGIVPHMGIPIAMRMFDLVMAIPFVVLVGIGSRWLCLQDGAVGYGQLCYGHGLGLACSRLVCAGQGWGEAVAVNQHQLGLAELPALLGRQPELMGVVARLQ